MKKERKKCPRPLLKTTIFLMIVMTPVARAVDQPGPNTPVSVQSAVPETDYLIGPEDILELIVFDIEELNLTVKVKSDGTIKLPLLGELSAIGVTVSQLEEEITLRLAEKYLNDPQVIINVAEFRSQRVSILGAVSRPGFYDLQTKQTLMDIFSRCGGIKSEAGDRCFIFRKSLPDAPLIISLKELLQEGRMGINVELHPGDVINIPIRNKYYIYVYGEVYDPGSFELTENITVLQAIAMAGGLGKRAAGGRTRIVRTIENEKKIIIKMDVSKIIEGKQEDIPLLRDDVVVVPQTFF